MSLRRTSVISSTTRMPVTRRATTLVRIELPRSPCLPLPRFLEGAPAGLLWPSCRATPLASEVGRRSLQRPGCLDPPAPASYPASHRELCGGRQRFWACISFGLPHGPRCRLPETAFGFVIFLPSIMGLVVAVAAVEVAAAAVWAWGVEPP
jgi:hypothetical protein